MTTQTWLLFLLVSFLTIACPGPAIVLAISNALSYQIRTVFFQSLGNLVGLLAIISLVILSMSSLLDISPEIFTAIKYCGATYIVYLGIRQVFTDRTLFCETSLKVSAVNKRDHRAFTEGMVVALANPQTLVFFLALFPNFLNLSSPLMPQFALLTASIIPMSFLSLMTYGYFTNHAKIFLKCQNQMRLLQRFMGIFMIILGIGLLSMAF